MVTNPYDETEYFAKIDKKKTVSVKKKSRCKKRHKTIIKKRCCYCKKTNDLTIDHKHPIVLGGTNDLKNLMVLCSRCNSMKSDIPHKQIIKLFRWFNEVQQSRVAHKKKPYTLR